MSDKCNCGTSDHNAHSMLCNLTTKRELIAYCTGLLSSQREDQAEIEAAKNLLAVIHRDGGHHTDAIGFIPSCVDAEQRHRNIRAEIERLRAEDTRMHASVAHWEKEFIKAQEAVEYANQRWDAEHDRAEVALLKLAEADAAIACGNSPADPCKVPAEPCWEHELAAERAKTAKLDEIAERYAWQRAPWTDDSVKAAVSAALDEARQADRAEIEAQAARAVKAEQAEGRLMAEIERLRHSYALLEEERQRQHDRAEAAEAERDATVAQREQLVREVEAAEARTAKLVEALEQIEHHADKIHTHCEAWGIAVAALAAAKPSEEEEKP